MYLWDFYKAFLQCPAPGTESVKAVKLLSSYILLGCAVV